MSIKIFSLINCPYSEAALSFLKSKNIKSKIVKVEQANKEEYKNDKISTFPQIYFVHKKNTHLLGGYNDIIDINNKIFKINIDTSLQYLNKKYAKLTHKNKLRLIKMINN
uniref:Glutaredoxin domain-containing protein n=1 Tax=viral metagenome TaxID=1070528 RepID=A0A6C0J5M9_9ZZZZ